MVQFLFNFLAATAFSSSVLLAEDDRDRMLASINDERDWYGVAPLRWDSDIEANAVATANQCLTKHSATDSRRFNHDENHNKYDYNETHNYDENHHYNYHKTHNYDNHDNDNHNQYNYHKTHDDDNYHKTHNYDHNKYNYHKTHSYDENHNEYNYHTTY
ncbi:MAG: hypothetical protein KVP17_004208 [Porospora cf. gigantea B]|uniref:uncharacterized protein n=1 Tax=Porospora cf. gigantea B TaxID=2853592 RepID=UPI003571DF15|nr:MAG: hypothetical protein KVP17_004208 [Porospora cf. gigantea B]